MRALLFFLLFGCSLSATTLPVEIFLRSNQDYEKGEYDSAIVGYQKILSMGKHDGRVYFNLGNAFFRKKQIGQALLHYEKANLLTPNDPEIQANLRFGYMATTDKIVAPAPGFAEKIIWHFHSLLGVKQQSILFLTLLYLLLLVFLGFHLFHVRFRRLMVTVGILLGLGFFFLSGSFFYKVVQENKTREAIVLEKITDARNAPDGDQILFSAHEGTKFQLVRKVGEWYLAGLANGISGWVHEKDLGFVEIGY